MKKHVTVSYKVETKKLGSEWNGYKIIMLSDFHNNSYGVNIEAVIEDIRKEQPDIILVAGDIYTGKPGLDNKNAKQFIKSLAKEHTILYGIGNHEQRMAQREKYGDMYEQFTKNIEECNVSLLLNESVLLKKNDSVVEVTGLRIDDGFYRKFKRVPMDDDYMIKTLGQPNPAHYHILLAHTPVYFEQYANWGADLILSGHLHGGMAKIPGIGGVIAPNYRLFPKYDSGMFKEYGSTMILGAGLGTHTINIRPFNPPELVVITIDTCNTD